MNFFGHAAVASWNAPTPGRVLGAMLPDFATMSGARLGDPDLSDGDIAGGIELHHTTDAAFHRAPVVLGLMRELDDRLATAGCARGPRRAVAHIGVELLLDGVLVDEPSYRDHYLAALERDPAGIAWREHPERFARLLERLRSYGVPEDLRKPEAITQRLHRMLSHRPLLAPNAADLRAIETSLVDYQPRVVVAVDTVLRAVRAALTS
jgi:acyl carrier protein phosphodiesterase